MKFTKIFLGLAALVYTLTLGLNDGIMALDEYFVGIVRYIPAQTSSLMQLVHLDDVKSPLQLLPMHTMAQLGLFLGIEHPYWQYRFVLTSLGILNLLLLGFVFFNYYSKSEKIERNILILLFCFYFVAPFAFTRVMFESMAAPWVALTALFAHRYREHLNKKDILYATAAISVAFILRQQVGICALVVAALPLIYRRPKDFVWVAGLGTVLFVISGIPDIFIRGSFHFSLLAILKYNVAHGADYAQHSIMTYPALLFALSLGPWWIMKYPRSFWTEHFKKYHIEWLMLLAFVGLHSLFPQKWERFLISIIPLLMILLVPLVKYLWEQRKQRRLRWVSLLATNLVLFFLASFFPPQKNLLSLAHYLDQHKDVKVLIKVNDTPSWFTDVFIKEKNYSEKNITDADLNSYRAKTCEEVLLVPAFLKDLVESKHWLETEALDVNFIDGLAYKLNPDKNKRRAPLIIYRPQTPSLKCRETS